MPKKLKNVRLNELSLVDNPANPHAKISIFKRSDEPQETKEEENKTMSFTQRVSDIRKSAKCSRIEAMRKAQRLHPDEFEAHQVAGVEASQEFRKQLRIPARTITGFDEAVAQLMSDRPDMKKIEVLQTVARERPDLLMAHRTAA